MEKRLILASASPRRRELLALLGAPFEVVPGDIDEERADLSPRSLAETLAADKAREVADAYHGTGTGELLALGADTVVVSERPGPPQLLAKPADADDARRMLALLSGTTHTVYTGLALAWWRVDPEGGGDITTRTGVVGTKVTFRTLSAAEIEDYLATGEPFDKAGAYGIQGHAAAFVEYIKGDYYNVVGLPLVAAREMLLPHFPALLPAPPPPPLPFPVYPAVA